MNSSPGSPESIFTSDSRTGADTRARLIKAAAKVFSRKGFDGATVKDICQEAGVNVSLISYYFDGKQGLYRACLEDFLEARLSIADNILVPASSLPDFQSKLERWTAMNLESALSNPEMVTIVQRDFMIDTNPERDFFRSLFIKVFNALHDFFLAAQKAGILSKKADTLTAASLFYGGIIHQVRYNELSRDFFGRNIEDPKFRQLLAEQSVRLLLEGLAQ